MKIRMVTRAAGPAGVWEPGSEVVVDDDVAQELISRGFAVPVRGARETATAGPEERAVSQDVKRETSNVKRGKRRAKAGEG